MPVGHDQQQHLEFARECVTNFNHAYGNHLVHPETIVCMLDAMTPFFFPLTYSQLTEKQPPPSASCP